MSDITSVPRADAAVTEWKPIDLPKTDPMATSAEEAEEELSMGGWMPTGWREPEHWEAPEWVRVDPRAASVGAQAEADMFAAGRFLEAELSPEARGLVDAGLGDEQFVSWDDEPTVADPAAEV